MRGSPLWLLAAVAVLPLRVAATAGAGERVEVRATLAFASPEIAGQVRIHWRNESPQPTRTVRLLLFANRFREPPKWNDLSRHYLLSSATYRPGSTEILSVDEGGRSLQTEMERLPPLPERTVTAVDLGREILPGEAVSLTVRFRTNLPTLADTFGASDTFWIADDGWYPRPLAAEAVAPAAGLWRPMAVDFELSVPAGAELLAGRTVGRGTVTGRTSSGRLTLILSRHPFERVHHQVPGRKVTVLSVRGGELVHRVSHNASPQAALLDSLGPIAEAAKTATDWIVARVPLRWYASVSTPDVVIVSDRLFEIHPLLRPLHQRELAYAVFLHEELPRALEREAPLDAPWIAEGLAWRRAESLYQERFRGGREVRDWIRLFDSFAIVDRFETAPRIPFLRAFFPVIPADDWLAIRIDDPSGRRPPGRIVFSRLETRLRPERFEALLRRYVAGTESFRKVLRTEAGAAGEEFLDAWLRPLPVLNYRIEEAERGPEAARFRIRRRGSDDRPDTIEVRVETRDGERRFFLDVDERSREAELATSSPVEAIELDPDRREIETRLDDNRVPPPIHVLLDSADVEVSSTEFGISGLLVGRRRYDYRKDVAAAGFYTSRGVGVNAGFQLHGGRRIDENFFRQNLFAYYSFQDLDRHFRNRDEPGSRTSGQLTGVGLRYNYFDAFWFENPSHSHHVRVFFDWYDRSTGGDFDYLQTGATVAATRPLRADTIVAAELLNGFTVSTGRGPIADQGLFSLGGFRSIRGIAAEEDLAENIFLVRAELRHMLPIRLDLDFEEVLVARRLQLKAFVDTGRVEDRLSRVYDPSGYAVAAGGGINLFYDFMGFFPSSFYLDVATRVDRRGGPQVLFGGRQAF